ncbi:MAG TPA: pentapeptide repeat-containing protein [Thermoanaerobaculia bacterium]
MSDLESHRRPLRIFMEGPNGWREADLGGRSLPEFFRGDLVRYQFTGLIPPLPNLNVVNFVDSILQEVEAVDVDFSECDFKDCSIRDSAFKRCKFDGNSFSSNLFSDVLIEDSTFYNSGIHGCEFRNVDFVRCNLTNLLMKSSKFVQCRFVDCTTSNKVMEMSRADGVTFEQTDIQIETVTSNFGITASDIVDGHVRTARAREEHRLLRASDIGKLDFGGLSDLERVRLAYFINPDFRYGSEALDNALALTSWRRGFTNRSSFVETFESFAEFVVQMFDHDQVTLHAVLLLHNLTDSWSRQAEISRDSQRLAMAIGGAHLVLSRIVEEFLDLLEQLVVRSSGTLHLIMDGPLDPTYYAAELHEWLGEEVQVTDVRPYNSAEVILTAIGAVGAVAAALKPVIAMVLSTRTSFELRRLKAELEVQASTNASPVETSAVTPALPSPGDDGEVLLSFGWNQLSRESYAHDLRVRALLPRNLLIELKIKFGTQTAGHLRRKVQSIRLTQ